LQASPRNHADFRLKGEAVGAVRALRSLGFRVFVVTNQPDLARGLLAPAEHERMMAALRAAVPVDDVAVCPHDDADGCECRKPRPGALLALAGRWKVDAAGSYMIGDSWKDMEAGRRAGCRTILVAGSGAQVGSADVAVESLGEAVRVIESELTQRTEGCMDFVRRFLEDARTIAASIDVATVEKMAQALAAIRERGGRLFFLGVGGGAGHASHAVNDFRKLAGLECYAPTDNVSELTARINDDGWDGCLAAWLQGSRLGARDGVFVFSVGGGDAEKQVSANLVKAVDLAKSVGATILGVVGRDGGHTARRGDAVLVIPTVDARLVTPHTEAFQAVIWHLLVSHPDVARHQTKWESVAAARAT